MQGVIPKVSLIPTFMGLQSSREARSGTGNSKGDLKGEGHLWEHKAGVWIRFGIREAGAWRMRRGLLGLADWWPCGGKGLGSRGFRDGTTRTWGLTGHRAMAEKVL